MDKFKQTKEDAIADLKILTGWPVIENTAKGVCEAVAYVYRHGKCLDAAMASHLQNVWDWANCEEEYHSGMSSGTTNK